MANSCMVCLYPFHLVMRVHSHKSINVVYYENKYIVSTFLVIYLVTEAL